MNTSERSRPMEDPGEMFDERSGSELAARLQSLRLARGWNMDRVAAAAGISRTTLFHLERGEVRRPRAATLHKLAQVLEVPVAEFVNEFGRRLPEGQSSALPAAGSESIGACSSSQRLRAQAQAFDRATNPLVTQVADERPELFDGWSADDWDELYSQFGVGGALTEHGVQVSAARINLNRDTVYRLRIVLQTHLADVAAGLVDTLYRQVCVGAEGAALETERVENASSDDHPARESSGAATPSVALGPPPAGE